jgi:lipoate-protein ligase A
MTTLTTPSAPRLGPVSTHPTDLSWRHLAYEVRTGSANMALDEALARSMTGAGEGVVRLYGWTRPTISFGKNEATTGYPVESMEASGFDLVRRPTGGRAVLHDQELTYAVVAPLRTWGGVREAYVHIHEALASALRELGAPVEGRKLVGSAQARIGEALLQHGSILLAGDQGPLSDPSTPAPITLRELVGDVSIDEVARVVADKFRSGLAGGWTDDGVRPAELELADELESKRYALDSWTFRR